MKLTPREVARLRLRAQRIAGPGLGAPGEVVGWLGAVQAQDYLGSLWAVGLRMRQAVEADVERAVRERAIVRTWPLRGTLHFAAAADVRWLLGLLGGRTVSRFGRRFRALGLDAKTFVRAERVLVRALGGGPLTRPAVYEALECGGVAHAGQRGIHILWRLAHEQVLCFGPREGKQHTFVLLDDWLGAAPRETRTREELLGALAQRYFTGHGPATAADLAWWAGLTKAEATQAIAIAGRALARADVEGRAHWLAAEADAPARPACHVLPPFDELLVGYADRSATLDPTHKGRINPGGNGMINAVLVVDGQMVGTWKRTLTTRGVKVRPAFFARPPRRHAVAHALRRYAAFLQRPLDE